MAQQLNHVTPGDLIEAAQFNLLIDAVNSALIRIESLETAAQPSASLAITQLIPAGPFRIGDTLQILGRNFQYSIGAARIFLNDIQVLNFLASTDASLQFVIPAVPGVTESGTPVELIVLNQTETVMRQIVLRPKQSALQGNVSVEWLSVDPLTIEAGQEATFRYRIRSGTNNRAEWLISPQISVAANVSAWMSQLRVLDEYDTVIASNRISIDPGETREIQIRILTVPADADGVEFGLTINVSADSIAGTSGIKNFPVGTATEPPDESISLVSVPVFSGGALVGDTLTVPDGQSKILAIRATFTVVGIYDITPEVLGTATGWSITPRDGTLGSYEIINSDLTNNTNTRLLRYDVAATSTATQNAQIEFTVQRRTQTNVRSIGLNVVRS